MSLSTKQIKQLEKIIASATALLKEANKADSKSGKASAPRKRRAGKELVEFRKMLKSEKNKGVPVAELAKKHGISSAYIYQL
jgi:hypothetical protein